MPGYAVTARLRAATLVNLPRRTLRCVYLGEETFDGVQPRRTGRREIEVPPRFLDSLGSCPAEWCTSDSRSEYAAARFGEGVTYLEDSAATIGGVSFWGSPWQPEYGRSAFNLPRGAALSRKWDLIPDGTDVLITHGPYWPTNPVRAVDL